MQSSLSRYILLSKRWIWVILLGIIICGGATYLVSKLMNPTYQATTRLILTTGSSQSSAYDSTSAALELLPTYSQLIKDPAVLAPVAGKYRMTIAQLTNMIDVKPQSNTLIVEITVSNSDPQLAAQIANDVADSFIQFSNTKLNSIMRIQVIPALPPLTPVRPRPLTDSLIGALVGLGLALALIIIFEWMNDRLENPEEVQKVLGIDTLTIIPSLTRQQRLKNAEETPALSEGSRILCANLAIAQAKKPFKILLVTSALAGEGKSTIAANLASFLALTGKQVLLVDADLRHPVLDQHFQLDNRQGLSNTFLEMWAQVKVTLEGQPTEIPSLRVLAAGVLPSNPTELLQSPLARQLFQKLRATERFDYIVIDTPPLLPIADAQILASYSDATILVADVSRTPRKILQRAIFTLNKTGAQLLGLVLNKSRWPDYGDIRDYLNHLQHSRPRADITVPVLTEQTSPNGIVDDEVAITDSLKAQKQKSE
jgi:capsular exopolysaccharide synthesis family protein